MQTLGLDQLPITKVRLLYDLPDELIKPPYSNAFRDFVRYWFYETGGVTRGETDIVDISALSPEELRRARALVRTNLRTRHVHIIEAAALLNDADAVPVLQTMLRDEPEESRRLTIAGSLWKLTRVPALIEGLERLINSSSSTLKWAHMHQILWLDSDRAATLLQRLIQDEDATVRIYATRLLNNLLGRR